MHKIQKLCLNYIF